MNIQWIVTSSKSQPLLLQITPISQERYILTITVRISHGSAKAKWYNPWPHCPSTFWLNTDISVGIMPLRHISSGIIHLTISTGIQWQKLSNILCNTIDKTNRILVMLQDNLTVILLVISCYLYYNVSIKVNGR